MRMSVAAEIRNLVVEGASSVLRHSEFKSWLDKEDDIMDGHVAINNSVLFREGLKTTKSTHFLCVPIKTKGNFDCDRICLASIIKFNNKFTHISPKDKKAAIDKFDPALAAELSSFGRIPLILIGSITDDVRVETPLGHDLFKTIVLDPTQKEIVTIDDEVLTIRDAQDEEAIWDALEQAVSDAKLIEPPLPLDLQQPFAKALKELRSESHAVVSIPKPTDKSKTKGLLDEIVHVLDRQIAEYSASLAKCKQDSRNTEDFNNILRISYNFSSDATKILHLLMSLCDLKPVLCWCTVAQWFALSEAFQKLPWSKSTAKPSLPAYHSMIGGARNKSFHNLFPFSKTLKVPMEGFPLEAISLTFFSEFSGRTNANKFEYRDQALIEAFTEFTRAGEKFVPFSFWGKNLDVMSATVELLRATSSALRSLSKIN
jgi:hypothetical protein